MSTQETLRAETEASAQNSQETARTESKEVLTVDEAAALLRVNRKTLYAAISLGQVPGVIRVGRVVRIVRSALLSSEWGKTASALGVEDER